MKILYWPTTIIALLLFIGSLLVSHLMLLFGFILGQKIRWKIADWANWIILLSMRAAGTKFIVKNLSNIPKPGTPVIIVSNHQSMFDVPFIGLTFKRFSPCFISKKELGKGIPYISMSLRNGTGILIDRGNPRQALKAIENTAPQILASGRAISIFPEGTRARDGVMKKFKPSGLVNLLKAYPKAVIVPVSIKNAWEILKYKMFPIPFGVKVVMTIHPAISCQGKEPSELITKVEAVIKNSISGKN